MTLLLTIAATLLLLVGVIYFGARKPGYSHLRDTISELGEVGNPLTRLVGYGLFLPVGLLLLGVSALTNAPAVQGLAACVGVGYVVAAFFPCDIGLIFPGSGRQQIHKLGGAVEYFGGAYFLNKFSPEQLLFEPNTLVIGAGVFLVGTLLSFVLGLSLQGLFQRVVEVVLFGSLIAVV